MIDFSFLSIHAFYIQFTSILTSNESIILCIFLSDEKIIDQLLAISAQASQFRLLASQVMPRTRGMMAAQRGFQRENSGSPRQRTKQAAAQFLAKSKAGLDVVLAIERMKESATRERPAPRQAQGTVDPYVFSNIFFLASG